MQGVYLCASYWAIAHGVQNLGGAAVAILVTLLAGTRQWAR